MSSSDSNGDGPREHAQNRTKEHFAKKSNKSDGGFFQTPPRLENQFLADTVFQRIVDLYIHEQLAEPLVNDLLRLGDATISSEILSYLEDAERNPPILITKDAFGNRIDTVKTSQGWKRLVEIGSKEGLVADGYDGEFGRFGQFAKYYIYSPSSAVATCPYAMTDGAARLLSRHLAPPPQDFGVNGNMNIDYQDATLSSDASDAIVSRRVFKRAYNRLISRHGNIRWSSGQWMTERAGGTDVSRSETKAHLAPYIGPQYTSPNSEFGPWVIEGHKFFSSATDADMTILLARTPGSEGLSAFFAPMLLPGGEPNGVKILGLKSKVGTKAVPTAEVEIKGMRGYLIGKEGHGIREVSTILNITRVHNSVTAASFMRRALEVAKAYARVRVISKSLLLSETPLHLRTLSHLELLTAAATHLSFFNVHLLSLAEAPSRTPPTPIAIPAGSAGRLLRIITPLTKAITAKLSLAVVTESLESLGGISYLENSEPLNLARLLRDAQVLSIWEGTTNVLAADLISNLKRTTPSGAEERNYEFIGEFIKENLGTSSGVRGDAGEVLERCKLAIWAEWEILEREIEDNGSEGLTAGARRVLWRLAFVVIGVVMLIDARTDGNKVAVELVRRWTKERKIAEGRFRGPKKSAEERKAGNKDQEKWDKVIVYEETITVVRKDTGHRL